MLKVEGETTVSKLRAAHGLEPGSRVDLEQTDENTFRAIEIKSDLSTGKRLIGYVKGDGGITSWEEPDLTIEHARLFSRIWQDFSQRVDAAEQEGLDEFLLMHHEADPGLFRQTDFRPANIAGNVKDGMLPVWSSLESALQLRGYEPVKYRRGSDLWELWARRRN